MSGILKSIGKVFRSIIKSPIFKIVAIAVAVYFTAGLAAGALGSTFAASLPGITGAANALGISAGAFGTASAAMGAAGIAAESATALIGAGATDASLGAAGAAAAGEAATGVAAAGGLVDAGTGMAALDAGATLAGGAESATGLVDAATLGSEAAAGAGELGSTVMDTADALGGTDAPNLMQVSADGGGTLGSSPAATGDGLTEVTGNATDAGGDFGASGSQMGSGTTDAVMAAPKTDNGLISWWKSLTATQQQMAFKGLSEGAKATVQALGQKAQIDAVKQQQDQARADVIRRGGVPDLTASYRQNYKTPGIVNAATKTGA